MIFTFSQSVLKVWNLGSKIVNAQSFFWKVHPCFFNQRDKLWHISHKLWKWLGSSKALNELGVHQHLSFKSSYFHGQWTLRHRTTEIIGTLTTLCGKARGMKRKFMWHSVSLFQYFVILTHINCARAKGSPHYYQFNTINTANNWKWTVKLCTVSSTGWHHTWYLFWLG